MANCTYCSALIMPYEPVGRCEACHQGFICEACAMQKWCKPCEERHQATERAEAAALPPVPKPCEPSWKYMVGVSRERAIWDELGYGS